MRLSRRSASVSMTSRLRVGVREPAPATIASVTSTPPAAIVIQRTIFVRLLVVVLLLRRLLRDVANVGGGQDYRQQSQSLAAADHREHARLAGLYRSHGQQADHLAGRRERRRPHPARRAG